MAENILIVRMIRTLNFIMRTSKLPRLEYAILERFLLKVVHSFAQCQIMTKPLIEAILVLEQFFVQAYSNTLILFVCFNVIRRTISTQK